MPDFTGREWSFTVPPGTALLTANQRFGHWGPVASRTKNLKLIAAWAVTIGHWPQISRAHITMYVVAPDRRRRDPANWAPTAKALVDGLVQGHLLHGDDYSRVAGPYCELEIQKGCKLHVRMVIKEQGEPYIP